jgi:alpha-ketoglutarate-dependent taurine dioxygenase
VERVVTPFFPHVEPAAGAPDPVAYVADHRDLLAAALARHGAIFFRGFTADSHRFEAAIDVLAGDPLTYVGGVSPRTAVHGTVYTATDAPPPLAIVQHHEMSYHRFAPRYLGFFCETAPPEGGATPLTDGRRVYRTLAAAAPDVVARLERDGVLFVRNYNDANAKGWREAWGTADRAELERLLAEAGVTWEWVEPEWLRTRAHLPAIARDRDGARVLFSCIHLWHRWFVVRMNAATGVPLPDDPARQPYATFFGDGSPIPEEFIALMHDTYASHEVAVPYQPGDFIVVDNLIVTHGRQPYTPPRRVLVTMRERVFLATDPAFVQPRGAHAHA